MKSPPRHTIRQLSPEERARLDAEASACAAELDGATSSSSSPTTLRGRIGRAKAATGRVVKNISAAVVRVFNRGNIDAALDGSASFAKLVAKYGIEAAREAVIRHVRSGVEGKIGDIVSDKSKPSAPSQG